MRLTSWVVLLVILILLFSCSTEEVQEPRMRKQSSSWLSLPADSVRLIPAAGLVYYQDTTFTGTAISYFPNGGKAKAIDYKQGLKDGLEEKWFEDQLLSFQSHYKEGKRHGKTSSWWRNGNLRASGEYSGGVAEGMHEQWYKSGAKFKRINLTNGKEEGIQQSWRENGSLYNNYEAKNGRIFGLKRANLCYALEDEEVQFGDR